MSVLRDVIQTADQSSQVDDLVKECLAILMKQAKQQCEIFEMKIEEDLQSGKTTDNLTISITSVVQRKSECRSTIKEDSSAIVEAVTKSMKDMFTGDENILGGISKMVGTAVTAIIGAGEGNEHQEQLYSVATDNYSIVRFDFSLWGRNIKAQSVKTHVEHAFACVAFKSSVDVKKLTFNEFLGIYGPTLKAAFGNDESKIEEHIRKSRNVYDMLRADTQVTPNTSSLIGSNGSFDEKILEEIKKQAKIILDSDSPLNPGHRIFKGKTYKATEGDF